MEILTLREEIAKEKDIPPFKVLDKQTIYKIITENSLTLEKLKQITSSYRQIQDFLPLMFEKIQHPQHQNRFPRRNLIHKQNNYHPDFSQKAEKLHIWRDSKAAELKIAPHLVLSHRQISSLASASINNLNDIRQVKILKTWQKQQFGDEIYRIVYSAKNIKDKSRS